ncbi:transporter substrate-binding domain-containing protein [Collinsella tanakaei]|uniref:transporter substrate-binding domain-containing protein n=1 Tax=Collinsella tanakaei TaxID=626935 RepID=UPI001F3F17D6|nr:transporter substrate-binding domain-containing protein [Collinsella tanakaei]MCF2622121.1 transporter substrate-binding domain-containing protein [Collinsella tanakaei]
MIAHDISRRGFLTAAAGVATLGLAGCGGGRGEGGAATASSDGDLLAQITERGAMTFATEGTWSPWTFHNEAGDLTGYDIEVARVIAERLGVEAEFAEGEWDGLLAGLDSGRYDTMANGVSVTDEREEKYDFTEPYAYNRIVVITTGDSDIASMDDLAGKTTANTLGSSYAVLAESHGATNTGVDDFNQTIQLLESGRIDATLNDEVVFYDYMNQHPEADLKIAAENDEPTHVAFPLRKEAATESLLAAMNDAIAALREDGTLSELSNEFFGVDITEA